MRVAAIALVLLVVAMVIFVLGDALNSWGPGSLLGAQRALLVLLICIPISLALFFFLSHHQRENSREPTKRERLSRGDGSNVE